MKADPMLTKKEACEALHVSERTIDRIVLDGDLPAYRVRGQLRYRAADIERYLEQSRVYVPPKKKIKDRACGKPDKCRYVPGMRVV